ncbi:MAG: leucine-rich repeat domain-containing protein [Lachnospiraceae bacterium]|nr:leucine-rich repeat domain-containing protein [Lachnospiraceae bacterium]
MRIMKSKLNMKRGLKIWASVLFVSAAVFMMKDEVQAEEYTDPNGITWEYNILDSGDVAVAVTENTLPDVLRGVVNVPASIDGYVVTQIANSAFWYNESLVEVIIPDTVTVIGSDAFHGCSSLKTVTYNPATMEQIKEGAFSGCVKLENFTLPTNSNYVVIYENTFYDCEKISSFIIPEQVYKIERAAFAGSGVQQMTIPNTVTWLGEGIFSECAKLTSVTLPVNSDITEVPESMFNYCSSLKSITIPSGYTTIGNSAFQNSALAGIYLPDTITDINASAFYSASELQVVQFTSQTVPTFSGESHFSYTFDTLKIVAPAGLETTYMTAMKNADNTLGIPENAEFVGASAAITVIPKLQGEITVTGTIYENQPISGLVITGTFLNALDNTPVMGVISWVEPSKAFAKGYVSEKLIWNFTPDASYGAGALTISGVYDFYQTVEAAPATVNQLTNNTNNNSTGTNNYNNYFNNNNNTSTSLVSLSKPAIKKAKKKGSKKAVITIKKYIKGATGYQIAVSTKKNKGFKIKKTIKSPYTLSATIKGLKKGKKYYVKVRAYTVVNGVRVYSGYSTVKRIK